MPFRPERGQMLKRKGFGEIIHRILCFIQNKVVTLLTEKQRDTVRQEARVLLSMRSKQWWCDIYIKAYALIVLNIHIAGVQDRLGYSSN